MSQSIQKLKIVEGIQNDVICVVVKHIEGDCIMSFSYLSEITCLLRHIDPSISEQSKKILSVRCNDEFLVIYWESVQEESYKLMLLKHPQIAKECFLKC
jgi:hypothetical protein